MTTGATPTAARAGATPTCCPTSSEPRTSSGAGRPGTAPVGRCGWRTSATSTPSAGQRTVDMDEEVRLGVVAEAQGAVALDQDLVAERGQRLLVERPALLQVADPQADVVDHEPSFGRSGRKNARRSSTSRSGASMAGKWPPRSNSDQCMLAPGSSRERMVVSAAKTATPVGGPVGASGCWASWPPGSAA